MSIRNVMGKFLESKILYCELNMKPLTAWQMTVFIWTSIAELDRLDSLSYPDYPL